MNLLIIKSLKKCCTVLCRTNFQLQIFITPAQLDALPILVSKAARAQLNSTENTCKHKCYVIRVGFKSGLWLATVWSSSRWTRLHGQCVPHYVGVHIGGPWARWSCKSIDVMWSVYPWATRNLSLYLFVAPSSWCILFPRSRLKRFGPQGLTMESLIGSIW